MSRLLSNKRNSSFKWPKATKSTNKIPMHFECARPIPRVNNPSQMPQESPWKLFSQAWLPSLHLFYQQNDKSHPLLTREAAMNTYSWSCYKWSPTVLDDKLTISGKSRKDNTNHLGDTAFRSMFQRRSTEDKSSAKAFLYLNKTKQIKSPRIVQRPDCGLIKFIYTVKFYFRPF